MKTRWIVKLYSDLCRAFPGFRKSTRRMMYRLMARHYATSDWTFMNYGYAPLDVEADVPSLDAADERNRYSAQLYHHVVRPVDLMDADVLEVGSGRGGGVAYIRRYHRPRRVVGVDFSDEAVSFSSKNHRADGLHFVTGDAEHLPFGESCFDAVVNVESSHCYGSMDAFLCQVARVLRPGGAFLFADFRDRDRIAELDEQLGRSGMTLVDKTDITPNALRALDLDHEERMALIRKTVPSFLLKAAQEFAGIKGSHIYDRFRLGITIYHSFVLLKP